MKVSILSILFLLVLFPIAQASQTASVELSSSVSSQSVQLTDQKFEPIYEQQPYEDSCSREVFDHTETSCETSEHETCSGGGTVCETVPDQVCNSHGCTSISRRECHEESQSCSSSPSTSCSDHSVYRTEYYSCTHYRSVVVGQRLVKTYNHQVEVVIDHPEMLAGDKLKITVSAYEDSVALKLVNTFQPYLLLVENQKISDTGDSTTQKLSERMLIEVSFSAETMNQLLQSKIENLELHSSGIGFELKGLAELAKDLSIQISLVQQRKIFRDLELFNGVIDSASLVLESSAKDLTVTIPVEKMKLSQLKSKKHDLKIAVSFKKPNLTILNTSDYSTVLNYQIKNELLSVYPN